MALHRETRFTTCDHYEAELIDYSFDLPQEWFDIVEVWTDPQPTERGPTSWTHVELNGPDGEVRFEGYLAIRAAVRVLTEIADRAEARRGVKLEAAA